MSVCVVKALLVVFVVTVVVFHNVVNVTLNGARTHECGGAVRVTENRPYCFYSLSLHICIYIYIYIYICFRICSISKSINRQGFCVIHVYIIRNIGIYYVTHFLRSESSYINVNASLRVQSFSRTIDHSSVSCLCHCNNKNNYNDNNYYYYHYHIPYRSTMCFIGRRNIQP